MYVPEIKQVRVNVYNRRGELTTAGSLINVSKPQTISWLQTTSKIAETYTAKANLEQKYNYFAYVASQCQIDSAKSLMAQNDCINSQILILNYLF